MVPIPSTSIEKTDELAMFSREGIKRFWFRKKITFGKKQSEAQERYRVFVQEGKNQPSPWEQLKNQIYLGTDEFVKEAQCKIDPDQSLKDIPKLQKQLPPKPLSWYEKQYKDKKEAMANAYLSGHYTLEEVGDWFGVSYATVSRAVKLFEKVDVKCKA